MNKSNNKISITAEFVSIMRSRIDQKNLYFVSSKASWLFNLVKKVFPKKLEKIFGWRLSLSEAFDEKVTGDRPDQTIELAAGYSLRGFNECLKNKEVVYVDIDFNSVISKKRDVLETICKKENIIFPKNYYLVAADLLQDDIFAKVKDVVSKDKKTLVIAEGLTQYFTQDEFSIFINNIRSLLNRFTRAEFCSHENMRQPRGVIYFLLRNIFVNILTRSNGRNSFGSITEFKLFLEKQGINNLEIIDRYEFLMYSFSTNPVH